MHSRGAAIPPTTSTQLLVTTFLPGPISSLKALLSDLTCSANIFLHKSLSPFSALPRSYRGGFQTLLKALPSGGYLTSLSLRYHSRMGKRKYTMPGRRYASQYCGHSCESSVYGRHRRRNILIHLPQRTFQSMSWRSRRRRRR